MIACRSDMLAVLNLPHLEVQTLIINVMGVILFAVYVKTARATLPY